MTLSKKLTPHQLGGLKAVKTIKKRFGSEFYQYIGSRGGKVKNTKGGFACDKIGADGMTGPERAKFYGKKNSSARREKN